MYRILELVRSVGKRHSAAAAVAASSLLPKLNLCGY
jgi:hypothetical protein